MTTRRPPSVEHRYRWLSVAIVGCFAMAFALGLGLHLTDPGGEGATLALHAGLVLLMASPAVRMTVAIAERLRRRDWAFVAMTLIVVIELAIVFWRAGG